MKMKSIWRGLSLAVFIIGVISFSQVRNDLRAQDQRTQGNPNEPDLIEPPRSFRVEYIDVWITPNGQKTITGRRTRYVNANGEWRLVPTPKKNSSDISSASPDHKHSPPLLAGGPTGVYSKEEGTDSVRYVSPSADAKMLEFFRSHRSLRNHQEFVRTDRVAGLNVYVLKAEMKDRSNPQEWVEESYSPVTGYHPLRRVTHFRDGSEMRNECVKVTFEDVSEKLNDDLKDLPIKRQVQ